jgi:hypothetical protein
LKILPPSPGTSLSLGEETFIIYKWSFPGSKQIFQAFLVNKRTSIPHNWTNNIKEQVFPGGEQEIHRQNVEVKNANGKKRWQTKRWMGQQVMEKMSNSKKTSKRGNVEWYIMTKWHKNEGNKRQTGQNIEK